MKETLLASEILRPERAGQRRARVEAFRPDMANMLERLVFIDEPKVRASETPLHTNRVKTTGWATVGKRLIEHARFGHRYTRPPACAGPGSSSRAFVATG